MLMTIKQLKAFIQDVPDELPVMFRTIERDYPLHQSRPIIEACWDWCSEVEQERNCLILFSTENAPE
jgi:hypothetical protein